jgi:hypothetical protein
VILNFGIDLERIVQALLQTVLLSLFNILKEDTGESECNGNNSVDIELPQVTELERRANADPNSNANSIKYESPDRSEGDGNNVTALGPDVLETRWSARDHE